MKRKWPWVLGASVLTGLVGSLALRKNIPDSLEDFSHQYVGEWEFYDTDEKKHYLSIQPSFAVAIDRREIRTVLIELTKKRLVLRDEYGYHLILEIGDNHSGTLYDEADDYYHKLKSIHPEND